jgi:hypothetical protein
MDPSVKVCESESSNPQDVPMQHRLAVVILFAFLAGCSGAPATDSTETTSVIDISLTPTDKPIALPSPNAGTLELVALEYLPNFCDNADSPFLLP